MNTVEAGTFNRSLQFGNRTIEVTATSDGLKRDLRRSAVRQGISVLEADSLAERTTFDFRDTIQLIREEHQVNPASLDVLTATTLRVFRTIPNLHGGSVSELSDRSIRCHVDLNWALDFGRRDITKRKINVNKEPVERVEELATEAIDNVWRHERQHVIQQSYTRSVAENYPKIIFEELRDIQAQHNKKINKGFYTILGGVSGILITGEAGFGFILNGHLPPLVLAYIFAAAGITTYGGVSKMLYELLITKPRIQKQFKAMEKEAWEYMKPEYYTGSSPFNIRIK